MNNQEVTIVSTALVKDGSVKLPAVPTRKQLEALAPADLWTLWERADEISSLCREINEDRLRQWIEVEGKTQAEVADLVGRSQATISERCRAARITPASNRGRPRIIGSDNSDPAAEVIDLRPVGEESPGARPATSPIDDAAAAEHVSRYVSRYLAEPVDQYARVEEELEAQVPDSDFGGDEIPEAIYGPLETYAAAISSITDYLHDGIATGLGSVDEANDALERLKPFLRSSWEVGGAAEDWIDTAGVLANRAVAAYNRISEAAGIRARLEVRFREEEP